MGREEPRGHEAENLLEQRQRGGHPPCRRGWDFKVLPTPLFCLQGSWRPSLQPRGLATAPAWPPAPPFYWKPGLAPRLFGAPPLLTSRCGAPKAFAAPPSREHLGSGSPLRGGRCRGWFSRAHPPHPRVSPRLGLRAGPGDARAVLQPSKPASDA